MFASHNQLHMYVFSNIVNLPSRSPGTAVTLKKQSTQYKFSETQVTIYLYII